MNTTFMLAHNKFMEGKPAYISYLKRQTGMVEEATALDMSHK
jgi:hypothetical protein